MTLARTLGISRRRLLGWEPTETHERFDADGHMIGWTVTTREPEWDDVARDQLLALAHYEADVCDCGIHSSQSHDKANVYTFQTDVCPVCAGVDVYGRVQHADDDLLLDREYGEAGPPAKAPLPADGRRTYLRRASEDEVAAQRAASSTSTGNGASAK